MSGSLFIETQCIIYRKLCERGNAVQDVLTSPNFVSGIIYTLKSKKIKTFNKPLKNLKPKNLKLSKKT